MLVAKALLGGIRRDGGYTLTPFFLGFTWQSILLSLLHPLAHECIRSTNDRQRRRYLGATNALEAIYTSPDSEIGSC